MKKIVVNIWIALLLSVALLSALLLLWYLNQRASEKNSLEVLKSQVFEMHPTGQIPTETSSLLRDAVTENLRNLQIQNGDMAAWIKIPGTKIDYPVMHTPESPEYYLRRNFEKKYSLGGLPFMQADCSLSPQSDNLILYGHNMKDSTMFSQLRLYSAKTFWEEHAIINLYTPDGKQSYEIFGVIETVVNTEGSFEYNSFVNARDTDAFDRFIAEAKRNSLYDTGIEVTYGDYLLTLSTCSDKGPDSRLVVVARQRNKIKL